MIHVTVPRQGFMLSLAEGVQEVCKPLEKIGITFFNYLKVFKDGSRIDLLNHKEIASYCYYESRSFINQAVEWCPFSFPQMLFWSDFDDVAWNTMREKFNVTHGISLLKHSEEFTEIFHFASRKENYRIINFYVNNLDLLKLFILYFKDKANKLISMAERNKIIPHDYQSSIIQDKNIFSFPNTVAENDISDFINSLNHKRYYLDGKDNSNNYLTPTELDCIKWGLKGKTAEETGGILGISKRTCEAHLMNVKEKLGHYKQLSLGYIIAKIFPDYLINN